MLDMHIAEQDGPRAETEIDAFFGDDEAHGLRCPICKDITPLTRMPGRVSLEGARAAFWP
jgi:hypothetical protein